jgi:hypothetical protein
MSTLGSLLLIARLQQHNGLLWLSHRLSLESSRGFEFVINENREFASELH